MAEIHIRNVRVGPNTGSYDTPEDFAFFMLRECYLAGGWQEIAKDTDPAWTDSANILLSLSDLAVDPANPRRVTSATGGFDSSHEGLMLTLFATDDLNRGLFNIRGVADSNTLYVDPRTRPLNWNSIEGSISGRVHKATLGLRFVTTSGFFVVQAPAASGKNLQLHFTHANDRYAYVRAYPKGDYGAGDNDTSTFTMDMVSQQYQRYSAFFPDDAAAEWYSHVLIKANNFSGFQSIVAGELYNVAAGDSDPGFLSYHSNGSLVSPIYMINELDGAATFYNGYYVLNTTGDWDEAREYMGLTKYVNEWRYKKFNPIVCGDNTADAGFIRGNNPQPFINRTALEFAEFSSDYWATNNGLLLPRNGPDDAQPMDSTAA